jgi:hypothetical protein
LVAGALLVVLGAVCVA